MNQHEGQHLMTVGELSRRTGLRPKSIRELEQLGLIYSAGRSEANYRLFDESGTLVRDRDPRPTLARTHVQRDPATLRGPPRPAGRAAISSTSCGS